MGTGEKWKGMERDAILQARFRRIGTLILAAGLLAAAAIYTRTPPDAERGGIGYFIEGGKSFVMTPNESKRYEYEMERIGGKANILASEIVGWFGGLWHGRRLAGTLAVLSVGGSLTCFFLAHLFGLPPLPEEERPGGKGA